MVFIDHQALTFWSSKCLLSPYQIQWSDFLTQFDLTFQYQPGKENIVADALLQKTINSPTVWAREVEDHTIMLIPLDRIQPTISRIRTAPEGPQGSDLINLIYKENRCQLLGLNNGQLVVLETTQDGSIFLYTALIREAHKPLVFIHPG